MASAIVLVFVLVSSTAAIAQRYDPTWDSLDSRPLPQWYDDAKVGIFIHWGVFSVPSFGSEWFWNSWKQNSSDYVNFMANNYPPGFTYQDFAKDFTAEFYDPHEWATIFQDSGAKYIVLTSKHHEGYTLWPSDYSFSWNAMDVGPNRDLLGELANAIRSNTNIKFGLYHSLYEWFNPLYLRDKANNFTTQSFVLQKTIPELYELVNSYNPEIIWSDGEWEASDDYWTSKEFIAWLFNDSPVKDSVVTNDRWGTGDLCNHGSFYTCADRYSPGVLQEHKWENCLTLDKQSWGYRRNAKLEDYMTMDELTLELAKTVSCNGNILINIGPTKEGTLPPIMVEKLKDLGKWLSVNGEAIYNSRPWTYQNDSVTPGVWYTTSGPNSPENAVYAIVLDWPTTGYVALGDPAFGPETVVTMLGSSEPIEWKAGTNSTQVVFPDKAKVDSDWAWVLKLKNLIQPSCVKIN